MKKIMQSILFICAIGFATNIQAQWQWAQQSSSSSVNYGVGITTDGSNNSYVVGSFYGTATFGTTTLTSSGSTDFVLTKTNSLGSILWAIKAGSVLADNGLKVAMYQSDVIVTGTISGVSTTVFSSTNGTAISVNVTTVGKKCFVARYNSNGVVQWVTVFPGTGSSGPNDIEVSDSPALIYLTGNSNGQAFVNAYNLSGVLQWSKLTSGTTAKIGMGVAADANGNCYALFQYGSGTFTIGGFPAFSNLGSHMLMLKMSSSGSFVWGQQVGASNSPTVIDRPRDIDLDASGKIFISGDYQGGTTDIGSVNLINAGSQDVFLAKFNNTAGSTTAPGSAIWAKKIGNLGTEQLNAQSLATDGSLYLAIANGENNVSTVGTCFSFSSQFGVTDNNFYIVKYNGNGDLDWATAPTFNSSQASVYGISCGEGFGFSNSFAVITGNLVGTGTFGSTVLSGANMYISKIAATPKFSVTGSAICANTGGTATISATPLVGIVYKWYSAAIGGVLLNTGNIYTTPIINATTTYYVSSLLPDGCESSRNPVTIQVFPNSSLTVGGPYFICEGECANVTFGSGTGQVKIVNGGNLLGYYSNAASPVSICPLGVNISYVYQITTNPSPGFCTTTKNVIVNVQACGKMENNESSNNPNIDLSKIDVSSHNPNLSIINNEFVLIPNPSKGLFSINTKDVAFGIIEIYNMFGSKVRSIKIEQGISNYSLDLSGQVKGMYLVNLKSDYNSYSRRIILE
jgi:Ig-like domain CHU_C associated/Secretion system C-terminal sorting domain